MIRLSSLFTSVALGVVVSPLVAQDIIPVTSIKHLGRYDIATQTFYPAVDGVDPDLSPSDADPQIVYDNATTNGFLSTSGGAVVANHHMDWGTLTTAFGQGAAVSEIRIGVATNLAVASGTPNVRIRLHQGAQGSGVLGTVIGDYIIPTLNSTVAGQYQGGTIDVTLPSAINMNDGGIGWSYNFDNPVGASTASTGILLSGPPNGPGTGAAKPGFLGFGAYDRILESSGNYVGTFQSAGPNMLSFCMRIKGRVNGGGPNPWQLYGAKQKVTLSGEGSATPGSVDNVLHVKVNPAGKSFILVAGLTQSDFFHAGVGLHFYAFPWLVQMAPIVTDAFSGNVDLPTPLPAELIPGMKLYIQCFGQNLAGNYVNWSEGLELTVQ